MLVSKRAVLRAMREVIVRADAVDDEDVWASIVDRRGLAVMPRLLHYMAERQLRRDELLNALRNPRVPIAFAWGMADPVSGAHVLAAIRPFLADAPVRALQGVGHYPQIEAPEQIASFLDETVSAWRERMPAR